MLDERALPRATDLLRRIRLVLSNPRAQSTLAELNDGSTSIVLSGGGGKGAYQIGCLLALKRLGVSRYAAIAGTSVGALNAMLLAQDNLRSAHRIWSTISRDRVMTADKRHFLQAFLLRVSILPVLLSLFASKTEAPSRSNTTRNSSLRDLLWQYKSLRRMGYRRRKSLLVTLGNSFVPRMIYPFSMALVFSGVSLDGSPPKGTKPVLIFFAALLGLLVLFLLAWWGLYEIHEWAAGAYPLFSNSPLAQMVDHEASDEAIKSRNIPCLVTLSSADWLLELPVLRGGETLDGVSEDYGAEPRYRHAFVPEYVDLRSLSREGIKDVVIQSAALPEVFTRRSVAGKPAVDGGVADNTPILPLLQVNGVRRLIVIYLEHHPSTPELLKRESFRIGRLLFDRERRGIGLEDARKLLDQSVTAQQILIVQGKNPPDEEGSKKISIAGFPASVLPIVPSVALGNMLSATLNFTTPYARQLMRLGFWDTLLAVERGMMELEPPPPPSMRDGRVYLSRGLAHRRKHETSATNS